MAQRRKASSGRPVSGQTENEPDQVIAAIAHLPRVELHIHLEGSIEPRTLLALARSHGKDTSEITAWEAALRERCYHYGSLAEFLEAFKWVTLQMDSPTDYALATTHLLERLASQNVRYAEITFSAGVVLWKKQPLAEIFEAMLGAANDFCSRSTLRVGWIFDAIRHFGPDHAREVLGWSRIFRDDGVVAFGIGGDEVRGPAKLFTSVFDEARGLGLHTTAHAGEADGPESVREAVELLHAERIGHGLAAARDPSVVELLHERGIPLEVCLSSNVATGAIRSVEDHPMRTLLEAGVPLTLNSDDPALFGTSLDAEIGLAVRTFRLTIREAAGVLRNAVRASFMSGSEKRPLLAEFDRAVRLGGAKDDKSAAGDSL